MLDGNYVFTLDTALGRKEGTVSLSTDGSTVEASVDAPVIGKQHLTGTADGDSFAAEGSMKMLLMGKIDYTVNGKVEGDSLIMHIHTTNGDLNLEGTRI